MGFFNNTTPTNKPLNPVFLISACIFSLITTAIVFHDKDKRQRVLNIITSKFAWFQTILIILFILYIYHIPKHLQDSDNVQRLINATKQAILGLIIAVLAYLELKFAPFWIIWIVSYYLS